MNCIVEINGGYLKYEKQGNEFYVVELITNDGINVEDIIVKDAFNSHIFYDYNYQYNFQVIFTQRFENFFIELLFIANGFKDSEYNKILYASLPTRIFGLLNIYSNYLLTKRLYLDAILFWRKIIQMVVNWEKHNNLNIHKGTAYGFLARIYMITGDIESAFLVLQDAINEDTKLRDICQRQDYPQQAPSYLTLSLNLNQKNFLFPYLNDIRFYLNNEIQKYNQTFQKTFTIETFDDVFLNNIELDEDSQFRTLKFMFVYYLWTIIDQSKQDDIVRVKGDFSNVHKLTKILGISVLLDEIIRFTIKALPEKMFGENIKTLNETDLWDSDLNNFNAFIRSNNYKNKKPDEIIVLIEQLLKPATILFETKTLDNYTRIFTLSYLLRNFVAHNIVSGNIFNDKFYEIMTMLLSVVFIIVTGKSWNQIITKP